jgi:DNA (cytosine-5)-methyltransferase 1
VESWDARRAIVKQTANNGNGFGKRLTIEVKRYPTPSALDWKNGYASEVTHERNSRPFNEQIVKREVNGQSIQPKSSLNPAWVEWLMGFPPGWTDLGNIPQESQVESPIEATDFED